MITKRILQALVLVGLFAALVSGAHRRRTETENQRVEIALDYNELRALAGAEGVPLSAVLQQFHQAGAVSVTLQEDTVGALEEARRITAAEGISQNTTRLSLPQAGEASVLQTALLARVGDFLTHKTHFGVQSEADGLAVNAPYNMVRGVGVGLDPEAAGLVRNAGLGIIGRVSNYNNVRPQEIAWTIGQLKQNGASTVLFSGDDVLGNKGFVVPDKTKKANGTNGTNASDAPAVTTASVLQNNGLNYATVEFGKQKGDAELVRAVPERVVRLHTILGSEMAVADMPGSVQRFLLAARERNIRVLFVRLFLGEANPLQTNTEYVRKITAGLQKAGLTVGRAHGYGPLSVSPTLRAFMGLGLAAAYLLLVDSVTGFLSGNTSIWVRAAAWGGAALLLLLPVAPAGGYKGAEFAALACAFVFPSLGLLHSDMLRPDRTGRPPLLSALLRFASATVITAVGACFVVGLLADRLFLIKSEAFVGVKVSELVPVLLVALVYGLRLRATGKRPWAKVISDTQNTVTEFLGEPIRWWQVAAALVVLIVLALLVMRSGNDPGVGVSGLELKFRSLLDRVTPARPRFKEMFGHPLLLVGLALACRGRRKWALPLVLAGAIGQADLLNTFCHLHTALPASVARAVLGLVAGLLFGIAAYLLLDRSILRPLEAREAAREAGAR